MPFVVFDEVHQHFATSKYSTAFGELVTAGTSRWVGSGSTRARARSNTTMST